MVDLDRAIAQATSIFEARGCKAMVQYTTDCATAAGQKAEVKRYLLLLI